MDAPHPRRSFTIRDLMVVIAIVAVGMALLPYLATTSRCTATRRTVCMNNLRNIAIALCNYANTRNRFPNAVTFGDPGSGAFTRQIDGNALTIKVAEHPTNPDDHDYGPLHSWVVDVIPGLDQATLYHDINRDRVSFDDPGFFGHVADRPYESRRPSNLVVTSTAIAMLVCPSDDTILQGSGNLSYVVNMGFSRWAGRPDPNDPSIVVGSGWQGAANGGTPGRFTWGGGGYDIARKTAVFFVGTKRGDAPWDMHHSPASIRDGTATTILVSENLHAGASRLGMPYGWTLNGTPVPTNWATAHPNYVGFMASDDICGAGPIADCRRVNDLASINGRDGAGWTRANRKGSFEAINAGVSMVGAEGGSPFPSSRHSGGIHVGMCDGAVRFVKADIDGTIWAKLITPDGERLPAPFGQLPLPAGADW
jgi:hypothetical protein